MIKNDVLLFSATNKETSYAELPHLILAEIATTKQKKHEACLGKHYLGPLHMSPVDQAGSVTGMNFALGSYEKFQPCFRDEKRSKILGTSSGAKFRKQSKQSETQKFQLWGLS